MRGGQRISQEVVEKILRAIQDRHPDLETKDFEAIRDRLRDKLLENIALVNSGMFPQVVMADLEDDGTLPWDKMVK